MCYFFLCCVLFSLPKKKKKINEKKNFNFIFVNIELKLKCRLFQVLIEIENGQKLWINRKKECVVINANASTFNGMAFQLNSKK